MTTCTPWSGAAPPARKVSQFIAQAIVEKLHHLDQADLRVAMQGGYVAARSDRALLNQEWDLATTEGWPGLPSPGAV